MLLALAVAAATWSAPVDVGPAPQGGAVFTGPGLHFGWIEGRRTFVRVTPPGVVHRYQLKRAFRTLAFDEAGRGLAVTLKQSNRKCRGKRGYRLYVLVQRLAASGRAVGRPQSLGDGCQNIGAPELAVNREGAAVLAWLEIPHGNPRAKKRVVIAEGTTASAMKAVRTSGDGDAAGHAVAVGDDGSAVVAFRRGSTMLVTSRPPGGRFGGAEEFGAVAQGQPSPATKAAIDATGAAAIAWTDKCACGEAGTTGKPNPLRVVRRPAGAATFGAAETLDAGQDVARTPALAVGGGATAVAWGTEDGPEAGTLAFALPGSAFTTRPGAGTLTVTADGTPMVAFGGSRITVRRGDNPPETVADGTLGFPRAFLETADGRTALLFQDGSRLKLSVAG
jgi:hypothetical protein